MGTKSKQEIHLCLVYLLKYDLSIYTCMCIYICVCVYIHINTYIHSYTHTHTHIYIISILTEAYLMSGVWNFPLEDVTSVLKTFLSSEHSDLVVSVLTVPG